MFSVLGRVVPFYGPSQPSGPEWDSPLEASSVRAELWAFRAESAGTVCQEGTS